jgi:tetratricopeptide (TPR) repeat protein
MVGDIALAERRYPDAVNEYRAADLAGCPVCALPLMGQAYDLAGNADSAIAVFSRAVNTPAVFNNITDGLYLAGMYKRLGELYEAKSDRQNALSNYTKFVELWKNADPELQPKVAEVRAKIARLSRVEGKP